MIALDDAWLAAHPLPGPGEDTDKNKRGRVLAAGGSRTVPGGLLLTAEAAFRAGAGKVQIATIADAALALGIALPEAAAFGLAQNDAGELADAAGPQLAAMLKACDTAVIGPAMSPKADCHAVLDAVLGADPETTLLLDAAMIGAAPDFASAMRDRPGKIVMTPHPGEMAVLMGCDEADVTPALAESAAERFGCTVALKRAETWIAEPGEEMLHYEGGGPGLATGGSGDVLAGILGGLLSRGAPPRTACGWAVWLHGTAGKRIAERRGKLGFLARELLAEIPRLMER